MEETIRLSHPAPGPAVTLRVPATGSLLFLDGIRGLAALSVVMFHAFIFTGQSGDAARELPLVGWFVGYGYLGVPVFIVLSGYVLMLPLVRQPNFEYARGVRQYLMRRGRRILPPYFAALVLSGALIAFVPVLSVSHGTAWEGKVPVTLGGVVSHIVLAHDASPGWINQLNGPLWSVAVEWQIYFLMPLLLIPLWRRFHSVVVVLAVVTLTTLVGVLGFAPWAHPWLVGLFSAGMLAAQISVGRTSVPHLRHLTAFSGVAVVVLLLAAKPVFQHRVWLTEVLVGMVFAMLLALLGRRNFQGRRFIGQSLLESRPLVYAGMVSYSIYLMHSPLLALGNILALQAPWSTAGRYSFMTFVVAPLAIAACIGFYYLVECHFKNHRQREILHLPRES